MTLITTNIYKTNKLHDLQMSPWVLEVFNKRCLFSYWCTPDPSQRCGRDINVISILDSNNVLFPMAILGMFSFRSVYGLYFTTCFDLVFRYRMFLFWRTKDVLPEMCEIILFHFSFCSHFRLNFT